MDNNNEVSANDEQQDLLAEEFYTDNHFVYASQGQRFVNYLVDNLLMRYGLTYLSGLAIGTLIALAAPDFYNELVYRESNYTAGILLLSLLIYIVNVTLYYTLCEKLFKGYTLGKLISGTRAIRQDGKELTLKDATLRSLSRLVPFEVFSGFNTLTWHDSWTDTMVIKAR